MINEFTRTYSAKGHNVNRIDCTIYYDLGGWNVWTGREDSRGYYFSIKPYEQMGNGCQRYGMFSGAKTIVLPVNRQSKKRYEEARGQIDQLCAMYLAQFCIENDIELGEPISESERERRVA